MIGESEASDVSVAVCIARLTIFCSCNAMEDQAGNIHATPTDYNTKAPRNYKVVGKLADFLDLHDRD